MRILIIGHGCNAIRNATNIVTSLPSDIEIAFLRKQNKQDFRFARYFIWLDDAVNWKPDAVIISCPDECKRYYVDVFNDLYILLEPPSNIKGDNIFLNIPKENDILNDGYIQTLKEFYEQL